MIKKGVGLALLLSMSTQSFSSEILLEEGPSKKSIYYFPPTLLENYSSFDYSSFRTETLTPKLDLNNNSLEYFGSLESQENSFRDSLENFDGFDIDTGSSAWQFKIGHSEKKFIRLKYTWK